MEKIESNWEMRVLLVDSDKITLKLVEKSLGVSGENCVVQSTPNLVDLFKKIYLFNPDVIVTARTGKGFDAYEIIRIIKQHNAFIPVFVLAPDLKKLDDSFLLQQGASEIMVYSELKTLYPKMRAAFTKNILELVHK